MLEQAIAKISAAGCEEPEADATELVAEALGMNAGELSADGATPVSPRLQVAIEDFVDRRAGHEPLAYILGHAEFRGIKLKVDSRVLIPRKETELLVEAAEDLPEGARVHEVGTGSGAIALALLHARPDLNVTASDLSSDAVEVARENVRLLGIDLEVTVAKGIPDSVDDVDLLIANLPYVTEGTIGDRSPEIRREPKIAVQGESGEDGLGVIRSLIEETPSGWKLVMEHDTHHGPAMRELLRDAVTLRDYEGDERVTVGLAP